MDMDKHEANIKLKKLDLKRLEQYDHLAGKIGAITALLVGLLVVLFFLIVQVS